MVILETGVFAIQVFIESDSGQDTVSQQVMTNDLVVQAHWFYDQVEDYGLIRVQQVRHHCLTTHLFRSLLLVHLLSV